MFKKLFSAFSLLLLPFALWAAQVHIYHTSDVHGYYFNSASGVGGYSALGALLAADATPKLLLDSGDFTIGTAEAKKTQGSLGIEFMNRLGYAAATIGNHELDFGPQAMLKNISLARFDILAANLQDKHTKTLPEGVKPYGVYDAGGKKIAVIGIAKDFGTVSPDFKVTAGRSAVKKALKQIKKFKADAIVLLVHESVQDNRHADVNPPDKMVKGLKQINLVLGGHAHEIVQNYFAGKTLFVESGTALQGVSKIVLDFDDKTGKLKGVDSSYLVLDNKLTGLDAALAEFSEANRIKELDSIVATAAQELTKTPPAGTNHKDSSLGNIFADIVRQYAGADIGLQNNGMIRKNIPAGPITLRVISEVVPFPNKIAAAPLEGKFIKKFIEADIKNGTPLYTYSGVEIRGKTITINGAPLDEGQTYTLAVNDYIAAGNSEGFLFKEVSGFAPVGNKAITDIFIDYLKAQKEGARNAPTGRIILED